MEVYEKPAGMSRWLLELFALRELLETTQIYAESSPEMIKESYQKALTG
jgi:hypothetical protein